MVKAAYHIHGGNQAWFWSGTQYARVTYTPGGSDETVAGPSRVRDKWTALANEDIGSVDAVCPVPGNEKRLYVFSGSNYMKLELDTESLVTTVEKNMYFFRGKEWIDVSWDDRLVSHGTIAESWPSLVKAKFETVDAILDNYDGTYYFFSGDRYARIKMEEDNDTLIGSPFLLHDKWSSLYWV